MKKTLTMMALAMMMALPAMAQRGYRCTYQMNMNLGDKLGDQVDAAMKEAILSQMQQMKMYFTLTFADGKSLFEFDEQLTNNPFASQSAHTVYADYGKLQQVTQESFFGRTFLIEEELPKHNWTLGTESRQIAGRTCTKAVISDKEGHEVVAWYSAETPIPAGPMGYWGLPGLIVELDMEGVSYVLTEAVAVDKPAAIKAPTKGKKVTRQELQETMEKKMQQMGAGFQGGSGIQVIQMH